MISPLKPTRPLLALSALACTLSACGPGGPASSDAPIHERYAKEAFRIPVRDGVHLYTVVYSPTDRSRAYPILLNRTPYGCAPYGDEVIGAAIHPSTYLLDEGYIFVCQDVRGRFMSEGSFDNMRPHVPGDSAIDESSDTYDTIEFLLANVDGHNGKVGQWGISYPGFYTAAALPEAHPALVASSPQAPIADFFFDDFHHHGAYTLAYWFINPVFSVQHDGPTEEWWFPFPEPHTGDSYRFYLDLGPLKNSEAYFGEEHFFWRQLVEHPNYDEFWQQRNILPHLRDVEQAVMTVGGWFDAEDLYGPLQIYRTLEEENDPEYNVLVMGPWSHGQWAEADSVQRVGHVEFGPGISDYYRREIEAPFFRYFLKGEGAPPAFEAHVYDTGRRVWASFPAWPPPEAEARTLYLRAGEGLAEEPPTPGEVEATAYVSDPNEPVPYTGEIRFVLTPQAYMTDDQRFAERRPDVIEFQTEVLEEDLTLAGDILAHLRVSTTGADADWVVKLIDVNPGRPPSLVFAPGPLGGSEMDGYQQMVRSEIIRGRFRNSYEQPEPFTPNQVATVALPLQDVFPTFRAGHRIMVPIQSSWFPLFDRNPQTWVDNIFEADEDDFVAQTHRVFHSPENPSHLTLKVLER
jgi:putative CocE/NonD family hydrolase